MDIWIIFIISDVKEFWIRAVNEVEAVAETFSLSYNIVSPDAGGLYDAQDAMSHRFGRVG